MCVHAHGVDARRAVAGVGYRDARGAGQRGGIGAHDSPRLAGHGVGHHTARDIQNHRIGDRSARDAAVIAALLTIAHREVGVGREQEGRALVLLEIPRHVGHARFLIGTEDEAHGIGALHIKVSVYAEGEDVIIRVSDDGVGMTHEQAARLLWEAQQKAEQEALRADPPPLELEPLRHRSRDATSPVEGRPWQSDES